jgi:hypothetical protein
MPTNNVGLPTPAQSEMTAAVVYAPLCLQRHHQSEECSHRAKLGFRELASEEKHCTCNVTPSCVYETFVTVHKAISITYFDCVCVFVCVCTPLKRTNSTIYNSSTNVSMTSKPQTKICNTWFKCRGVRMSWKINTVMSAVIDALPCIARPHISRDRRISRAIRLCSFNFGLDVNNAQNSRTLEPEPGNVPSFAREKVEVWNRGAGKWGKQIPIIRH